MKTVVGVKIFAPFVRRGGSPSKPQNFRGLKLNSGKGGRIIHMCNVYVPHPHYENKIIVQSEGLLAQSAPLPII